MSKLRAPKPLSASQLAALDYIVDMGGSALDGSNKLREQVADSLRKRGCVERAADGTIPSTWCCRRWHITQQGTAERSKAHEEAGHGHGR